MGVPGERGYYPPEELVWDASRDSAPRCLRSALAAHSGLSPDSLLLAKHQADKHTWDTISSWVRERRRPAGGGGGGEGGGVVGEETGRGQKERDGGRGGQGWGWEMGRAHV